MTNKPKKLIEVAMPVKEVSAESVRDKSIRERHARDKISFIPPQKVIKENTRL